MRMRKKKNGAARIEACRELLITEVEKLKEEPQYAFSTKRPLHLEIGCGKGSFACGMSNVHQDINFIAMEKVPDVACLALEKAKRSTEERNDNLRFLIGDAKNLLEWFPKQSIDCIYLNFSDPWPKSGHAKRRLTYRAFLSLYQELLVPSGILAFKTDNEGLFDFSIEEFQEFGLETEWITRDLHNSEHNDGNVMTEYETLFSSKGQPIYAARLRFPKKESNE
ncbi:MAG: tRNA (guanosine(46)-N7)-methyltransferase TrmB [Clostridia bacterium]|nr:tRNA (guanosine(46)-N7)-methyltransferase TrmB [Clostridia bacterium]